MIDQLKPPEIDEPYAEHLEIMRLVISMNSGAAKAAVRPIIDGSGNTTIDKVRIFGIAIADALRCYAEAVHLTHGLPQDHVIRAAVTAMRAELADPTGGGIAVQVGDDLLLAEAADALAQTQTFEAGGDDLADRAIRSGQEHDSAGAGPEAEEDV